MEVEGEVDERRTAYSGRIDESCLIEADRGLALVIKLLHILLRDEAKTDAGMGMAEQADTCRVCRDGGEISTKGIHRTTHTHITGCTIPSKRALSYVSCAATGRITAIAKAAKQTFLFIFLFMLNFPK